MHLATRRVLLVLGLAACLGAFSVGVVHGAVGQSSQIDDPALDETAWSKARLTATECPPELLKNNPGAQCWDSEGFPETDPAMPLTVYERAMYCDNPELSIDRSSTLCAGAPIDPEAPNADVLKAYGADQSVTGR